MRMAGIPVLMHNLFSQGFMRITQVYDMLLSLKWVKLTPTYVLL